MQIEGSTIVVTGAGRGLGKAISHGLASAGANVALVDVDETNLEQAVAECSHGSGNVMAYVCNITHEQQVIELFDDIESDLGTISGLVNNAGILRDGLLVKAKDGAVNGRMSLADWQAVIDVNLTGVFLCGREAASRMIESETSGAIINISSVSKAGNAGQSNYSAAKAGVAAMTVTWAKELARYGIRVSGIAPGVFETDMVAQMKPEAYERIVSHVPLRRTGDLTEMAETVRYLLESDYFTGRILELDGGLRM